MYPLTQCLTVFKIHFLSTTLVSIHFLSSHLHLASSCCLALRILDLLKGVIYPCIIVQCYYKLSGTVGYPALWSSECYRDIAFLYRKYCHHLLLRLSWSTRVLSGCFLPKLIKPYSQEGNKQPDKTPLDQGRSQMKEVMTIFSVEKCNLSIALWRSKSQVGKQPTDFNRNWIQILIEDGCVYFHCLLLQLVFSLSLNVGYVEFEAS